MIGRLTGLTELTELHTDHHHVELDTTPWYRPDQQNSAINNTIGFMQVVPTIGDFTYYKDDISYKLDIKDDITTLELAHLTVLFTSTQIGRIGSNCVDYIIEKNLSRHFIIDDPNEPEISDEINELCSMD